jgi:hypothetical protein
MKKAPRSEAEVFAELTDLARSEGYVHAVALICCRDNLILYVDDIQASDLQKLYRRDRLIRTEITTLLGLLARGPIDVELPEPEVVQKYVTRTDALMEELHVAIGSPMLDLMKAATKSEDGYAGVWRGEAMREPIFYGGESAFQFQYRDLAAGIYRQRRLLESIPLLIVVSILVFALLQASPGSPLAQLERDPRRRAVRAPAR